MILEHGKVSDEPANGEESVHKVHGQAEDLRLAAELLADLQHPVRYYLSHVRFNLYLNLTEILARCWRIPEKIIYETY